MWAFLTPQDSVNSLKCRGNWIYSKHLSVIMKHGQDDTERLWGPWQVRWTWRQFRSHNKLLTAKDFTRTTRLKAIPWFHQDRMGKNKRPRPRGLNPGQRGLGKADSQWVLPTWHPLPNKLKVYRMGIMPNPQHGCMTSLCYKCSRIFSIVSLDSLVGHMGQWQKDRLLNNEPFSTVSRSSEEALKGANKTTRIPVSERQQ